MTTLLLAATIALAGLADAAPSESAPDDAYCRTMRITGYSRYEYSGHTYDGTPILTGEPIVAASWDVPIDSTVEIEGLGTYRVADRGMLGSSGWIDVAVWSRADAFAITGWREVCVYPPGGVGG